MKKAECQRIDVFKLWCWRRRLRVPWTARRSNQSILKEISPGFPMSQLFTGGGQSTGVSALASFLPKKSLQNGLAGSPCSPRDSQQSSPTPEFKSINSSALSFLCSPTLTSIHIGKTIALTRRTFVGKEMSLLLNMLYIPTNTLYLFFLFDLFYSV